MYQPLTNIETDFEKGEKAKIGLYIDGQLHASTEDYFGRYYLFIYVYFFIFLFLLNIFDIEFHYIKI